MKRQKTLTVLSWLIAALALLAAGAGVLTSLLWQGGGTEHYAFTSLRGGMVQIWGAGAYTGSTRQGELRKRLGRTW